MAVLRWRTPRLRSKEEAQEAKVTSVDLFYDLVFAVVVAQLATALSGDLTLHGFLVFALLFVAVARVWSSETLYSDRFEIIDVSYRIEVFFAMLPAGGWPSPRRRVWGSCSLSSRSPWLVRVLCWSDSGCVPAVTSQPHGDWRGAVQACTAASH